MFGVRFVECALTGEQLECIFAALKAAVAPSDPLEVLSIDGIDPSTDPEMILRFLAIPARDMSLRFNGLTAAHTPRIVELLRSAPAIRGLDLYGNNLQSEGLLSICSYLFLENKNLQFLGCGSNAVSSSREVNSAMRMLLHPVVFESAEKYQNYRRERYIKFFGQDSLEYVAKLMQRLDDQKAGKKPKKGEELTEREQLASAWEKDVSTSTDGSSTTVQPQKVLQVIDLSCNDLDDTFKPVAIAGRTLLEGNRRFTGANGPLVVH